MVTVPPRVLKLPLGAHPAEIDLEPVHNCNLRRPSCHVPQTHLTKDLLSLSDIARLGENPGALVRVGATFEPTTHPDFPQMVNILGELGMRVWLTTNGTLLTDRVIGAIHDKTVFEAVTFSFDAATPELYEKLRKGAKFDKALERIKAFVASLDRTRTTVRINYTAVKDNLCDVIPAIDLWDGLGVDAIGFIASNYRENNKFLETQMHARNIELFRDAFTEARQYVETNKPSIKVGISDKFFNPRHTHHKTGQNDLNWCTICSSPYQEVRILWDGKITICFGRFVIGNVKETSLSEAWSGVIANGVRQVLDETTSLCATCDYFFYCRLGMTDIENGK